MCLDIPATCLLRVSLYGPLEIWKRQTDGTWEGLPQEVWGKERVPRAVFKRLLAAPRRRLSRGRIAEDLWPDSEAEGNLYRAISIIRSVIGHDLLLTRESAYELAGQDLIWLDSDACVALLKEAESRDRLAALPLLEAASVLLERGEYLENESGTWCYALRKPHEILLKQCRLWLAEGYEAEGKYLQATLTYQTLLQAMPPDEKALQGYMLMLHRQGKAAEALQCYQEIKEFAEEQGYTLSSLFDALLEQMRVEPLFSHVLLSTNETLESSLFTLKAANHPSAWSPLLETIPSKPDILYDGMEVEAMAAALHWRRSFVSLIALQGSIQDIIRKHDTMHKDQSDHETRISRRHALQAIGMFPIKAYGVQLFTAETVLFPSDEALPLCAAGITACWELRKYGLEGMQAIQRILAFYLPMLERVARQSLPSQQSAAYLASQGYILANILANHNGKWDQMEVASQRARFYGQIAQNPNLEVSAMIRLATKFDIEDRFTEALEVYQEAVALPDFASVSPLLQGRVYAGLAGTYAYCQQPSKAFSFLSQAKEIYPTDPETDPSFSFAACNRSTLAVWEGMTFEYAGHYTEAIDAFTRFGSLTPLPGLLESHRTEHLNHAALAAVKQRDLDRAFAYLDTANEIVQTIQHKQRQKGVRETFRHMQLLWPDEPQVKALQEKIAR